MNGMSLLPAARGAALRRRLHAMAGAFWGTRPLRKIRGYGLTGRAGLLMNLPTPTNPKDAKEIAMKVRNSLKSLRGRHRDNRLVRRKGRVYIINKTQRRFKARQG